MGGSEPTMSPEKISGTPASVEEEKRPSRPQGSVARSVSTSSPSVPANFPPAIRSLRIVPPRVFLGDSLKAEVEVTDRDGDLVSLSYTWFVNGRIHSEGRSAVFPDPEDLKKFDQVYVRVTPSDSQSRGIRETSRQVQIANRPPRIQSSPSNILEKGVYTYQVQATDPDGDRLKFGLTDHPSGMTIDSDSGLITWKLSSGFEPAEVRVTASDGDGGEAFQQFRVFPRSSS